MITLTSDYIKEWLPKRKKDAHKGDFGKLLNIAGSEGMSGAAALSTLSALRCGTGIVTTASTKDVITMIAPLAMEALTLLLPVSEKGGIAKSAIACLLSQLPSYSACSIGCGMSFCDDTIDIVQKLIAHSPVPLILDADGINAVSPRIDILQTAKAPMILTPHPGEMGRLLKLTAREVNNNRGKIATALSQKYKVTVVLKGYETLIASPDKEIYKNPTGNSGMAKGGSGDVLTGMIASFAAQGLPPHEAACCGVFLHGLAGDIAAEVNTQHAMLPRDIISSLPAAFRLVLEEC